MNLIDNASIIEEFECPVCYEYIAPPFTQCIEGHSMCINCYYKVTSCPICRSKLCTATSKVLTKIYNIAKFPCPYNDCEKWMLGNLRKRHLKVCSHRDIACKLCGWSCKAMDFIKHLHESHSELIGLEITKPMSMFPFTISTNQFALECSISSKKLKVNVHLIHGSIDNWIFKLNINSNDGQLLDILGTGDHSRSIEHIRNYMQSKGPLKLEVHVYDESYYKK